MSVQTDIDNLKKKIEVNCDLIKTLDKSKNGLNGKYKYYATLLERISEEEEVNEEKKEEKKEYLKPEAKFTNIRDLFGMDPHTSLYEALRQLGILR